MLLTTYFRHLNASQFHRPGIYGLAFDDDRRTTVSVIRKPSNVGGSRLWMECVCGRSVVRLYLYKYQFRCRHCYNLKYPSQAVDGHTRACWKEEKWGDFLTAGARRPKGMHRKTYRRIKEEIKAARQAQDDYLVMRFINSGLFKRCGPL